QPVRRLVPDVLGPVLHATGRRLSLPEHNRDDLPGRHGHLRDRRSVLETREHVGWLPGDADGCYGSHHPVLLPAFERERHRLLRIWPGRPWTRPRFPDGEARSDVAGRRETLSRALEET